MKVQFDDHMACKVYIYVNDGGQASHGKFQGVVLGSRQEVRFSLLQGLSSGCASKQTFPLDGPGPWAGTVCHTSGGEIIGTVSQEKWEKTQSLVNELDAVVQEASVV